MKRLCFLPLILFTLSLSSGQPDIPPQVKKQAIQATNEQISSVYHNKPISPSVEAIIKLRDHIDRLNATNIIFQTKLHKELLTNDSITHVLLRVSLLNDSLRASNQEKTQSIDLMKKAPNYFFFFILVIMANLIAYGIAKGWKEARNRTTNKNQKNDI